VYRFCVYVAFFCASASVGISLKNLNGGVENLSCCKMVWQVERVELMFLRKVFVSSFSGLSKGAASNVAGM
jgi:hypothetical protein